MNNYETLYILENTLDDAAKEAIIAKFNEVITGMSGTVETVDKWGAKRLAYPINDKTDGYYVLVNFTANSAVPAELERIMKITDDVLRYIVIRK